jgi:hypothetical protein
VRAEDIKAGDVVAVNRDGDLYMDYDARPFIDQRVLVLQRNKNGTFQVQLPDGRKYSFASRNLDEVKES